MDPGKIGAPHPLRSPPSANRRARAHQLRLGRAPTGPSRCRAAHAAQGRSTRLPRTWLLAIRRCASAAWLRGKVRSGSTPTARSATWRPSAATSARGWGARAASRRSTSTADQKRLAQLRRGSPQPLRDRLRPRSGADRPLGQGAGPRPEPATETIYCPQIQDAPVESASSIQYHGNLPNTLSFKSFMSWRVSRNLVILKFKST